jgi:uncharacterized protein
LEEFEWDEDKAASNLEKHAIDFRDAARIFEGPVLVAHSVRAGERRWKAVGALRGRPIAVIYTMRGKRCRIISARMARRDEKEAYRQVLRPES